ncbi:hypothetical protein BJ546DRAFT_380693 [Cryomyces antarcticus]
MPGRSALEDGASSMLERLFNDMSFLKAHKNLPRRRNETPTSRPVLTTNEVGFSDDETLSHVSSQHVASPQIPSAPMTRQKSGLPLTPPSVSNDAKHPTMSPPPYTNGAFLLPRSGVSTPSNQRSPQTPDTTPPRSRHVSTTASRPPPIAAYPSSRAESFRTARENQSSDGEGSDLHLPLDGPVLPNWLEATRPLRLSGIGLGLDIPQEVEDDDATPTERYPGTVDTGRDLAVADGESEQKSFTANTIPNREWDTNLMRNVTVRRRRPHLAIPKTPPQQPSASEDENSPSIPMGIPVLRRGLGLRERVEQAQRSPHSASTEKFGEDIEWPSTFSPITTSQLHGVDTKRFSGMSSTSTIIEAFVVDSPPRRRQTLRHVSKTSSLREAGSLSNHSNRASIDSTELPVHRLVHKKLPIPDRRNRNSYGLNGLYSARVVSSPERPLKENTSLTHRPRSITAPNGGKGYFDIPHRSATDQPNEAPPSHALKHKKRLANGASPETRLKSPPPSATDEVQLHSSTSLTPESLHSHEASYYRNATPRLLPLAIEFPRASQGWQRHQPDVDLLTPETERIPDSHTQPSLVVDHTTTDETLETSVGRPRLSLDHYTAARTGDHCPHPSLDHSGHDQLYVDSYRSFDQPRLSIDQLTAQSHSHADDQAQARQEARHHSNTTPFSMVSDDQGQDALEVSEATAVSIYPHNNNSLLVVQRSAGRPTRISRRQTLMEEEIPQAQDGSRELEPEASRPIFEAHVIEPLTPHVKHTRFKNQVVSPLSNPREAPEPPMIKCIPPTPGEELEERQLVPVAQLGEEELALDYMPPRRSLSLVQRARRYSDTFIQPFFTRSHSLDYRNSARGRDGRRATSDSQRRRASVISQEPRDTNLHPFWRPRDFWDDLSDSDDDYDAAEQDVLPEGGDTSDIHDIHDTGIKRSKLGSLRPSGGFLIGNSLGLSRQPSNGRGQHAALPASLLARLNRNGLANRVRKPASITSLRRAAAQQGRSADADAAQHRRRFYHLPGLGMEVRYVASAASERRCARSGSGATSGAGRRGASS